MMKNAVVAATSFTVTGITMLSLERSAGSVCYLSQPKSDKSDFDWERG